MRSCTWLGLVVVFACWAGCGGEAVPTAEAPDEPVAPTEPAAPADPAASVEPAAPAAAKDQSSPKACVESFLANLRDRNKDGALALGTQEWQAAELGRGSSFVNAVFSEGLKVERWTINEVEGEGDSASVRAKTLLVSPQGEEDNEPMRFTLMRLDDQWWIIELN